MTNTKISMSGLSFIILFSSTILFSACQCEQQERITSESAKIDAEKLLSDLKIDYKGIHCSQPRQTLMGRNDYVNCDVTTKSESIKINCKLHDCTLIEKRALRIKFGILK